MPSGVSEEVMNGSAKFRSQERVPRDTSDGYGSRWMVCVCLITFLVYCLFVCLFICLFICLCIYLFIWLFICLCCHVCYEFVYVQAALCRCSHPLSGMVKRSSDDETYLEKIT